MDVNGNYPEWVVYAAKPILDEIEKYGLDGYDLDYEPMGNGEPFSDGACFVINQSLIQCSTTAYVRFAS